MLRKNWHSLDGRWQMAVVQHFGWDAGNKLNKEVGRQMGKVAMQRLMKELGITGVKDIRELKQVSEIALNLFFPPPDFEFQLDVVSDTKLVGSVRRCVILDNMKRTGAAKHSECTCFATHAGWYAALGADVEETLGESLKEGDSRCEILVHVKSWKSPQLQALDRSKEEDNRAIDTKPK